jgi:hypothetical protein
MTRASRQSRATLKLRLFSSRHPALDQRRDARVGEIRDREEGADFDQPRGVERGRQPDDGEPRRRRRARRKANPRRRRIFPRAPRFARARSDRATDRAWSALARRRRGPRLCHSRRSGDQPHHDRRNERARGSSVSRRARSVRERRHPELMGSRSSRTFSTARPAGSASTMNHLAPPPSASSAQPSP